MGLNFLLVYLASRRSLPVGTRAADVSSEDNFGNDPVVLVKYPLPLLLLLAFKTSFGRREFGS